MIEKRIAALDKQLKEMAALARTMLDKAVRSIGDMNLERINEVTEEDEVVANQMETWNLEEAVRVIALFQPMGEHLRRLVAIILHNRDLERIADHAENICKHCRYLAEHQLNGVPENITRLTDLAMKQFDDAVETYTSGDEELAKRVIYNDAELNELTKQTISLVLKQMATRCTDPDCDDAATAETYWRLSMIARNLERIGDHATNIAESVLFVVESHLHLHHKKEIAEEIRALDQRASE